MFFQLKSYLKFITSATNQHGVHSPFVYDLVTKCFNTATKNEASTKVNAYLLELLKNNEKITVTDFGAGSKHNHSKLRSVSSIAKNAGISRKRSRMLIRLVQYLNVQEMLEIGTSLGLGTASLSQGNTTGRIISLEGCPETAKIAKRQLSNFGYSNIDIVTGEFSETLPVALEHRTFDLIYFDGNHKQAPTLLYFEQCLHHIHNNSVFIFDDIYWSKEMNRAWNVIKNHSKVTVSIDTFRWGLVFFRQEQVKQHFTIRI